MTKTAKKILKKPNEISKKIARVDQNLLRSKNLLIKYGLKMNEKIYKALPAKKREEMIEENIQDFLKNEYDLLYEDLAEKRKTGKDLFIQELKMRQLLTKQKICYATMNYKDIEKYMLALKKIEKSAK